MNEKLNSIIEKYKNIDIYETLKKYYATYPINQQEYNNILKEIKKT